MKNIVSALIFGGSSGGGGGGGNYNLLINLPQINSHELKGDMTSEELGIDIPDELSDLQSDSEHRTVSDTEKATWNGKANTSDIPHGALASKDNVSATYTPTGSVNVTHPTYQTASIKGLAAAGSLPTASLDGEKLIFNPGSLPTSEAPVNALTGFSSIAATFAGTEATITSD